jgi:hypothetical protein
MTPKQEQELIAQLKKELEKKDEQIAGLTKRINELESARPASKSRQQAIAALHMLEEGPLTMDKLITLNKKYPSDPIYYVRTLLQKDVKRVKINGQSVYMLPAMYETWLEGQKKEKEAAEASKNEVKESIPPKAAAGTTTAVHA